MRIIDIHKFITPAQRQAINLLASYGRATGIGIHLFGGFVRDVALGRVLAGVREQEERDSEPPLLTGHDLMAMGVPQGPEIGRLLRLVADAG